MLKFINSLATIEINQKVEAIQLTFNNSGSLDQYPETMNIAVGFAKMHRVSSYLLVKEQFNDISSTHFHALVQQWLLVLGERSVKRPSVHIKVALLTNAHICQQLADATLVFSRILPYAHLSFTCHSDHTNAYRFLNPSATPEEKRSVE